VEFSLQFFTIFYNFQMVERNLETVLVLEDDVRFESNFRERLTKLMTVANSLSKAPAADWDLL